MAAVDDEARSQVSSCSSRHIRFEDAKHEPAITARMHLVSAVPAEPSDNFYRSTGQINLHERGPAWHEWMEDLARYRAHHGGSLIKPLLLEQSLYALLTYRLSSGIYRTSLPFPCKQVLLLIGVLLQKLNEILTGVTIPYAASLGPGQYIGHYGPTVVNPAAVIGPGCNLSQGVTIGISGRGGRRGVPRLGARVYVGANATIAGNISIGDDVLVGANSLVIRDVPDGCTVVGVPAEIVDRKGTKGMGLHQHPWPIHR